VEGGKPEAGPKVVTEEEITAKEKELDSVWSEKNKLQDKLEGQGLTEDEIRSNEDFRSLIDRADVLSSEIFKLKDSIKEEVTIDKPTIAINATVELDRVKSVDMESEDGATFNLDGTKYEGGGLIVPVASTNTTVEEITPEMIADFVEANSGKIGDKNTVKVGIYKFPNSNKVSIDLNVVAPESSRGQAIEFGKQADQESLFDLSTFENVKTGGTGMNPMQFTDDQFKEIAKALNEGRVPNVFGSQQPAAQMDMDNTLERIKESSRKSDRKAVGMYKAVRTTLQALPGVKIIVHDTTDAYREAIAKAEGKTKEQVSLEEDVDGVSSGTFLANGEIHIDATTANAVTVFHEAFHYALMKKGLSGKAIREMVDGIKKSVKNKELLARVEDFANQYSEGEKSEEFAVELGALLAATESEMLTPNNLQKFFTIINNLFKKVGLPAPFTAASTRQDAIDFINSLSKGLREGTDVGISEGITSTLDVKERKNRKVNIGEDYKLSFVTKEDLIDIDALVKDIESKGQKVWFWVADQLGRGMYDDAVMGDTHYLDAGPSFALDPENRSKGVIWASGAEKSLLDKNIKNSDYIFIISGSPQKSKLFNKSVFDLYSKRIGDFKSFKKKVLEAGATKSIQEVLNAHDSWESLRDDASVDNPKTKTIGTGRKKFLIGITDALQKPNSKTYKVLESLNAILDIESLRDDFYRENEFDMNDVMIVLKPTAVGGKSSHSTYENDILGEVVGVPDKVVNAADIMPDDVYEQVKDMHRAMASQKIAPYGSGVKNVKSRSKRKLSPSVAEKLTEDGNGNYVFQHWSSGKRDVIKPGSGQNSITGKDEASSLSAVGGLAQFYTMKDQSEPGTGNVLHTVLVPMDKVYDAKEDPMNFEPEARRLFNEARPGQGFDEGYRAAFITKVANQNGFDMTVYPWRNTELRAQTTIELTPESVNVEFKDRKKDEYNVGDKINVYGRDAVVTSVDGPVINYKGETSQGSINVERSPRSIRKKRKAPKNEAISKAKEKYDISIDRGNSVDQARKSAMSDLKKNDWYANASDIEREDAVRDLRKFFGLKEKSAPSVAKVSATKKTTVTVDEKTALKDQLKRAARAARGGAKSIKDAQKAIATEIKAMVETGRVSVKQAASLTDRLAKLNTENPIAVERFLSYAERVFERADYAQRLSDAFKVRRAISRLSKGKSNQAEVKAMGKAFLEIDPSMVDDIDVYTEMANMIYDAMKPSKSAGTEAIYKNAAVIADVNAYTEEMVAAQEEQKKQDILNMYNELVTAGVISSDMSLKDIQTIISKINENLEIEIDDTLLKAINSKIDTGSVKEYNKGTFDMLSTLVRETMKTGVDPLTGEKVKWDDRSMALIKKLMNMDLDRLSIKEQFSAIESIQNFMVNGITSGIEATVNAYEGTLNADTLANEGVKSRDLKVYFSKMFGRMMSYEFASLPVLMDSMFGGVKSGGRVMEMMGLTKYANGIARATKTMTGIINEYGEKFSKSKPNGEAFNTAKNTYERGMLSFLKRTVMGTDLEMDAELARRIGLLRDSITELRKGSKEDNAKADIYDELFNKLGLDRENVSIIDIEARVDATNRQAVDWWISKWAEHYPDLYDVSLSVFNTQLGKDLNYTPDRFSKIERSRAKSKEEQDQMLAKAGAFSVGLEFTDKSKSGVLMESNRPQKTPGRFVDLDFDVSNSSAMKSALIDINTAGSVRQVDAFLNSESFSDMIPNEKDYKLLINRVNDYIRLTKSKEAMSYDSFKELDKALNVLAGFGTVKALGGVLQPIKQVIPVMINTLVNAGNINMRVAFDKDYNEWLNNSGMAIANRGMEASSAVESANKYLDKVPDGKVQTLLKAADSVNQFWLKTFLSNSDVFIARASFEAYYKQDLKRRGKDTNIDWSNHKIDQEAANYAQHMVDRQQNISDTAMGGKMMASNQTGRKILRKTLLPFANFVMNQKNRMYSDIRALQNPLATKEDKATAFRSLVGLSLEMMTFQAIAYGIREAFSYAAAELVGWEPEDEEEKKKQAKYAKQNVVSQGVKDFVSPVPLTDGVTLLAFNYLAGKFQDVFLSDGKDVAEAIKEKNKSLVDNGNEPMTADEVAEFTDKYNDEHKWEFKDKQEVVPLFDLGTPSIVLKKTYDLYTMLETARTGEFEKDYQGRKTKMYLTKEDKEILKTMVALESAYLVGAAPVEVGQLTNKVESFVKKKGMTETQKEKYDAAKEKFGKVEPWMMEIVKSKKKEDGAIQEIEWVKSFGDLNEKQGSKYVEIFKKREGQVTYDDMMRISKMK